MLFAWLGKKKKINQQQPVTSGAMLLGTTMVSIGRVTGERRRQNSSSSGERGRSRERVQYVVAHFATQFELRFMVMS